MDAGSKVTIIEEDAFICGKLRDFLNKNGLDYGFLVTDVQENAPAGGIYLNKRQKIGVFIDESRKILQGNVDNGVDKPQIGPYMFDEIGQELVFDGQVIRLTEKEAALLALLLRQDGKSVPREDLLTAVWGYVSDVETHTLETHIYRLRQKIEKDPYAPVFLVTDEDGYALAH